MHARLEIVMPPTDSVEVMVEKVMAPYNEDPGDELDNYRDQKAAFWDWYEIGGRWDGVKVSERLDKEKVKAFYADLDERKITVSGVQAGKPSLAPEEQVSLVNAIWREHFPDGPFDVCPFFKNTGSSGIGNVMRLGDIEGDMALYHMMIADGDGYTLFALREKIWNGAMRQQTAWDGSFRSGLAQHVEEVEKYYAEEVRAKNMPTDDWLVVTVDYHS